MTIKDRKSAPRRSDWGSRPQLTGNIPSKFVCKADGKLETADKFSNSQIAKYTNMVTSTNSQVSPADAGLICKKHIGIPEREIKCEGPCGMIKGISAFSKNNRKASSRQWCLACMSWSESDHPTITPLPAPQGQRSIEERELYDTKQSRYAKVAVQRQPLNLELVGQSLSSSNNEGGDKAPSPWSGPRAPQRAFLSKYGDNRGPGVGTLTTRTYETESRPTNSSVSAAAGQLRQARQHQSRAPQYNAWGPDGQVEQRVRQSTTITDTASETTSAATTKTGGGRHFAKINTRRTPLEAPFYIETEDPDEIDSDRAYDDDDSPDEC